MRCAALAALISLAGCAISPAPRIYILAPAAESIGQDQHNSARAVQLQPVLIPDYLDTTDMVLRAGPHELNVSQTGRWGERLSEALAHALRSDLAKRLPESSVIVAPPTQAASAQILVSVDALDMWLDGNCVLIAHWRVGGKDGQGAFSEAARGEQDGDRVAVLADLVGRLADRIAAEPGVSALALPSQSGE